MSQINEIIHENSIRSYNRGAADEREKLQKALQEYFELTQMPNEQGLATDNVEWDAGFQAAMAVIRAMK